MEERSVREDLVDTALGAMPADLAICGGNLVNVLTREIYPADILIKHGRIAAVLPADTVRIEAREKISASGRFVAPGLIDPHMHIESSALTLAEFARAVVPRGVSTIIADPHEFGNIMGLAGIELVLEDAKHVPLNVLLRVPPRIPELAADLETPGQTLSHDEICGLLARPEAACLAGDVSPLFYVRKDAAQFALIAEAIRLGKTVSGYSPGLFGGELNAYVAAGAEDSHTPHDVIELQEDLRAGLNCFLTPRPQHFDRAQFRALARIIAEEAIDTSRISFCTDDIHTDTLLAEGQLDARVRLAIEEGIPPVLALQMATLNPARAMRIDRDHGAVAAGRYADLMILGDLATLAVETVFHHGRPVVEHSVYTYEAPQKYVYPPAAKQTIRTKVPVFARDFQIRAPADAVAARCRVIDTAGARKKGRIIELPVRSGVVQAMPEAGVLNLAVIDRHHGNGNIGRGFVANVGIAGGALASTINHNVHHLYAVGADPGDMALAVNRLVEIGGGYVAVRDGVILGELALPIIGMISELPLEELAAAFRRMDSVMRDGLGCTIDDRPLLRFNFLCSPVSREVGLTDLGFVNSMTLELEPVVVSFEMPAREEQPALPA